MQEVAAELGGGEGLGEQQDIDAHRLQCGVVGQQFEQHAVKAGPEQADIQAVGHIPEIGGLAQREKQEQVVEHHCEEHAVEGAVPGHEVFLGLGAGAIGAEEHRQEYGTGGVYADQQVAVTAGQLQRKPEITHLHRALGKGKTVATFLLADPAVGRLQVQLQVVEQGVVDFQKARQGLGQAIVQFDPEPPDGGVLAEVDVVMVDRLEAFAGRVLHVLQAQVAAGIFEVAHVRSEGQAHIGGIQACRAQRPGAVAQAQPEQNQTHARHQVTSFLL